MAVEFTSVGYSGTVDEKNLAEMQHFFGAQYGVRWYGDWRPTTTTAVDRGVQIAPGRGYGHFVMDDTADTEILSLDPASPNRQRWDFIVCRRDWRGETPGGVSKFQVIKGIEASNPAADLPALGIGEDAYHREPGTLDDQPIALARVTGGSTTINALIDLRWRSQGKVMTADSLLAFPNPTSGDEVVADGVRYRREPNAQGLADWIPQNDHWARSRRNGSELEAGLGSDTNPEINILTRSTSLIRPSDVVRVDATWNGFRSNSSDFPRVFVRIRRGSINGPVIAGLWTSAGDDQETGGGSLFGIDDTPGTNPTYYLTMQKRRPQGRVWLISSTETAIGAAHLLVTRAR